MATTPGVATTAGPTSASPSNQTTTQSNGSLRTTMRSSSAAKANESNRKQSPSDSATRRPPTQKAWTGGTNPLTSRGSTPSQTNGIVSSPKSSTNVKTHTQKEGGLTDKHAHDRLIFMLGASIGLPVQLTTRSGEKYQGLMAGSSSGAGSVKLSIKMTRKAQSSTGAAVNGHTSREAALVGSSPDFAMNFDLRDVADVLIPELAMPEPAKITNGTTPKFQTDADISGNQTRGERALQKWVPDAPADTDFSLETNSTGDWDQFATNRQLFGARSTYDENLYTTMLDRSSASYKMREANAARIAKEIESSSSTNTHLREERGQTLEKEDEDEEDKYSGVRRAEPGVPVLPTTSLNKYTPPAKRPPTGQTTVSGAPVDPAIVSAQISRPDVPKASTPTIKSTGSTKSDALTNEMAPTPLTPTNTSPKPPNAQDQDENNIAGAAPSPQLAAAASQTEGVEAKVLQHFRQFAEAEKHKLVEKKRAQASHDRNAKMNELIRFSKTFKLKTPIPNDLIGILAKDPEKQEAIVERAQQHHEESTSVTASPAASTSATAASAARKIDLPEMPAIPDRQSFNRGRGGFPQNGARSDRPQQPPLFPPRTNAFPQRTPGNLVDRKSIPPHPIPAPIPIVENRMAASGALTDQSGLTSPQRSTLQTPISATSSRFNLNVKASEFRPNAAAPSFNPAASSNTPSSPASIQRTASISRAPTPSTFFGLRKPKPSSERPSISSAFNPLKRMREEVLARKGSEKSANNEEGPKDYKDYSANGGIPNAFQTGPRWTVRTENAERTYQQVFEKPVAPMISPAQSRSGSTHQIPYHNQLSHLPAGPANIPQISTPQHLSQGGSQPFNHQFDDNHQRMQVQGSPQVFPSPSVQSRQMSAYASPLGHHAQLTYGQSPFFGTGGGTGPMQMQMRQYSTPNVMHAQMGQMSAPMMAQQQSNGPYMQVPQQYAPQMSMYSPSPAHVYPQQNGFGSPSRAPMMMQQGSQQGHHHGTPMMYTMSAQGGPMVYQQPGQGYRGGYAGNQYGANQQHPFPMQQRTMSGGYGQIPQKILPQQMQPTPGAAGNVPQQPAAFGQLDRLQEDGK